MIDLPRVGAQPSYMGPHSSSQLAGATPTPSVVILGANRKILGRHKKGVSSVLPILFQLVGNLSIVLSPYYQSGNTWHLYRY